MTRYLWLAFFKAVLPTNTVTVAKWAGFYARSDDHPAHGKFQASSNMKLENYFCISNVSNCRSTDADDGDAMQCS